MEKRLFPPNYFTVPYLNAKDVNNVGLLELQNSGSNPAQSTDVLPTFSCPANVLSS
jgi:hypothetical protein